MATPQRRSHRLRGQTPQQQEDGSTSGFDKLATLIERESTPELTVPVLVASAAKPNTPKNVKNMHPSSNEMHPAHHQSTAKKVVSAKRIGISCGDTSTPTKIDRNAVNGPAGAAALSNPSFEFTFNRRSTELSSDAKKMMEQLRGQAEIFRTKLNAERERNVEAEDKIDSPFLLSGRKIAQPKRKAGRFSDVHSHAFKKMDSIANHPSAFRADPTRFTPKKEQLKRTNSNAGLDSTESSPKRSAIPVKGDENPAKRVKRAHGIQAQTAILSTPQQKPSALPVLNAGSESASYLTPTKASQSRNEIMQAPKSGSKIPTILRTPSTPRLSLSKPVPATAPVNKQSKSLVGRFNQVKSILRRPQMRFSDDPAKIAAGTHISTPKPGLTVDFLKDQTPGLPTDPGTPSHRREKHVNFPSSPHELIKMDIVASPMAGRELAEAEALVTGSPVASRRKIRATLGGGDFTFRANHAINFGTPSKKLPATPSIRQVLPDEVSTFSVPVGVKLSDLPNIPHGLSNKKRKRSDQDISADGDGSDKENSRSADVQSEESSPTKRAKFTTPTKAPAGLKRTTLPSTPKTDSRIKLQTRPSGLLGLGLGSRTPRSAMRPSTKGLDATPTPKKGVLSMSRLNALAMPKARK